MDPQPSDSPHHETKWQLQEAKQRFSELIRGVEAGDPQVVTRHGRDIAVVVPMEEYRRMRQARPDFKDFLTPLPDVDPLEIQRSQELPRDVVFE